jgi:transposase-like protein
VVVEEAQDRPVAGVDYPGTWPSFEAWFPDEAACRAYLARVRWPDGFVCPNCGGRDAWLTGRELWMCRECGRQTSVTAGTIFHRSRYPLTTWFAAMWFVCSQKNGVSALGLQRAFGFGSYETAWAWLHKLRRAMVRPDRDLLGGEGVSVELDQTFLGGRRTGRSGPRYDNKAEVIIAVERQHPKGFGRVRLAHIVDQKKVELFSFMQHNLAHGTILYTDGDTTYPAIVKQLQIHHEPIALVHAFDPAHVVLPGVHLVASLLKRWLAGTLHDGRSERHLPYYLDEFTFRFNRRTSRSRGMLWYRLVQQAVNTDPHPLRVLQHKI